MLVDGLINCHHSQLAMEMYLEKQGPIESKIWDFVLNNIGVNWKMPRTTRELLQCWYSRRFGKTKMINMKNLPSAAW
ncbi:hypothetical protein H5410_038199 [Solanum commersonii]|uniref:Uncharacterized protein n=1 Tax=Solanum commersonii TaxID=4109 RepID=A0A9J5YAM5_SOLCO|nr:hypothetical protein H5410_038199 [Solanum commersonii]